MKYSLFISLFAFTVGCEYPVAPPKADYNRVMGALKAAETAAQAQGGDQDLMEGEKVFKSTCTSCHGEDGKAMTAAAAAMNPKPKNLTNAAWQTATTDAEITKAILEGGASVGLSATMPAWGSVIDEKKVVKVVKYIRSLKEK
ncbi:MAG: c-type cytochrome [Pseudomonadota bacterium]